MRKVRLAAMVAIISLAALTMTSGVAIGQGTDPESPDRGLETPPGDGSSGGLDDVGTDDRDNGGDGGGALDQQILDDLIVDGSICAGLDCVNGESFGFDTIRIKENNLRIRAVDTSTSASFPSNDWQITFNDSSNGGQNKFSIDDIDGGRTPFTIEAGAPSHSLYVDDGGRLGLGTSTPVADIHVKSGNTPTARLEQDGSSGFTAQTWDVAGNEANFFIRDATNGSTLPFRIYPGSPTNALVIEASTGDIGMGTNNPTFNLDVEGTGTVIGDLHSTDGGAVQYRLISDSTNRRVVALNEAGTVQSQFVLKSECIEFAGANAAAPFGHIASGGFAVGACP